MIKIALGFMIISLVLEILDIMPMIGLLGVILGSLILILLDVYGNYRKEVVGA